MDIHWIAFSRDGTQLATVSGGPVRFGICASSASNGRDDLDWELPPDREESKEHALK